MSVLTIKIISFLLVLATAIVGGLYPLYQRKVTKTAIDFPIGEAIASGVFLGAGLLHMLGDSSQDYYSLGYSYPLPFLLAGIMFLFLLWLEHMGRDMQEHQHGERPQFAILAVVMLSIHSLLAGTALGLSTTPSTFTVLLIAILAHKWAAAFALAIQLNKSTLSHKKRIWLFAIFAGMTPLGIIFGSIIISNLKNFPLLEIIFSALAAGTFLYLGTLHGLSRSFMIKKCCNLRHFSFVIVGFVIMAIVAIWT